MKYKTSKYNIIVKETEEGTIVYNSYSGGISEFDPQSYQDLINVNEDSEYFQEMIKQGFLVPEGLDEFGRIMDSHHKYIFNSTPDKMQFTIAPTLKCPLNCYYCFENTHNGKIMSMETAEKLTNYIINSIDKNANCKQVHITWFGGEPLLAVDIIKYIGTRLVEFCASKNIMYTGKMITNGVLFKNEVFDDLIANKVMNSIQFTLDGNEETFIKTKRGIPGMFEKNLNGIKYASKFIETYVRMNTTSKNQEELLEIVEDILKDVDTDHRLVFYAMPVVDYGMDDDNAKNVINETMIHDFRVKVVELLKKYDMYKYYVSHDIRTLAAFCGAMRLTNITFGPDGEMYRCENLIGNDKYIIGNLEQGQFYNEANYELPMCKVEDKCKECPFLPVCWGGCPVHAHIYHQEFDCEGFKKNFADKLLNRI